MSQADDEHELRPASTGGTAWRAVTALVLLAAVAGTVVGIVHDLTRERIADNVARHTLAELTAVLPTPLYDNEPHRDIIHRAIAVSAREAVPLPLYRARRAGQPAAAVLTVRAPNGYVGPITLLVAIGMDARVIGVRVASHSETPGIGDEIDPDKSGWLRLFDGMSLATTPHGRWRVRSDHGDIDQLTGATISSRAVVAATRAAVQYFTDHRDEIFAAPTEDDDR